MAAVERHVDEIVIDARGAKEGADEYARAADRIVAAEEKMRAKHEAEIRRFTQSENERLAIYTRLPQSIDRVTAATQKLAASLDPVSAATYKAANDFTRSMALIDRSVMLGLKTQQEAAVLEAQIRRKQIEDIDRVRMKHQQLNDMPPHVAANDNMAANRRQNLTYQGFDIGQSFAGGMPLGLIAAQQGPQIVQSYLGPGGGAKALLTDIVELGGTVLRIAGPVAAGLGTVYGAYKLLEANSVSASLAVDDSTAALAAQAAPIGSLQGMIGELAGVQMRYREAITATSAAGDAATALAVANTEREFNARKALLEIELKRQEAALAAQRSELAIAGQGLKEDLAGQVFTDMSRANNGFSDPRVGRFVNLPDDITGLSKAQAMLDANPIIDKMTEMRSNLTLGELAVQKLRDALGATFNGALIEPVTGAVKATTAAMDGLRVSTDAWGDALARIKSIGLPQLTDREALDKAYGSLGSTPFGDANDAALGEYNKGRQRLDNADAAVGPTAALLGAGPRPNREDVAADAALAMDKQKTAYDRVIDSANDRIAQMRQEASLFGQYGAGVEAARYELQMLSQAQERGKSLTDPQKVAIHDLAAAYGGLADQMARAKVGADIRFELEQMNRSPLEQSIHQRFRGTGIDPNGPYGDVLREKDRIEQMRDGVRSFFDDFSSSILQRGESVGEAFGHALQNGLMKAAECALDQSDAGAATSLFPEPKELAA